MTLTTINIITQYLPFFIYFIIFGLISYFVSLLLAKKGVKMLFVLPSILIFGTIVFGIAAYIADDWGALGYLILALLCLGGFIASAVTSTIIYFTKFKNTEKKD